MGDWCGPWDCWDLTRGSVGGPVGAPTPPLCFGKRLWSWCSIANSSFTESDMSEDCLCAAGSHHSAWLKASRAFGWRKGHGAWERYKWARERRELWCQVRWLPPQRSWASPVIRAAALRAARRLPVSPDFLKPSPRYTDRAKQVGQLYWSQQGHVS